MPKPKGYIVWEGESWFDGTPIVCIVTLKTSNRKTGDMAQVWILRADIDPVEAIRRGEDRSICGSCVHRGTDGFKDRSCYVDAAKAPLAVYQAAKRGVYPRIYAEDIQASLDAAGVERVRLGAYGDPAFVPFPVLSALVKGRKSRTGYTHQWRRPEAWAHRALCMASCDTYDDVREARMLGWRCFYVGSEEMRQDATQPDVPFRSMPCPASDEAGKKTTCDRCGLCSGALSAGGRDLSASSSVASVITILPHGNGKKSLAKKIVALTIGTTN
jgi:hypothetical protein